MPPKPESTARGDDRRIQAEALDRIVDRLERAAALVDECARLAGEAGAELDREVRSADAGSGPAGQLALDQ